MPGAFLFVLAAAVATAAAPEAPRTPVLAHAIARGDTLSASDFELAEVSEATARGALSAKDAAGQEAVRALRAGAVVKAHDVAAPRLVHRGETVSIELTSGALHITSSGRALNDAAKGEVVRVVNLATNRTLEATASAAGQVSVELP